MWHGHCSRPQTFCAHRNELTQLSSVHKTVFLWHDLYGNSGALPFIFNLKLVHCKLVAVEHETKRRLATNVLFCHRCRHFALAMTLHLTPMMEGFTLQMWCRLHLQSILMHGQFSGLFWAVWVKQCTLSRCIASLVQYDEKSNPNGENSKEKGTMESSQRCNTSCVGVEISLLQRNSEFL